MRRSLSGPALIVSLLASLPLSAPAMELEPYVFVADPEGDVAFPTGIGCIAIVGQECPVFASAQDSDDAWGLGAALRLQGPWWVDLRWSQQEAQTRFFGFQREALQTPGVPLDVSHLHAGLLYRFRDGRWSPFATAFAGASFLSSDATTPRRSEIDLRKTSGGLGAGVMADLGSRVGLRVEVRGTRTDLPGDFDRDLEQLEGSVGLRFRVGS